MFLKMLHKACKFPAQGLKGCCTGHASMLHRVCSLRICCTWPASMMRRVSANMMQGACKYAAQGPQLFCTGPQAQGKCSAQGQNESAAQVFQICTRLANVLCGACKSKAQGLQICRSDLQICCTGPTNMMHRARKYASHGLQICSTGPTRVMPKYAPCTVY